jgi:hypothetical protein
MEDAEEVGKNKAKNRSGAKTCEIANEVSHKGATCKKQSSVPEKGGHCSSVQGSDATNNDDDDDGGAAILQSAVKKNKKKRTERGEKREKSHKHRKHKHKKKRSQEKNADECDSEALPDDTTACDLQERSLESEIDEFMQQGSNYDDDPDSMEDISAVDAASSHCLSTILGDRVNTTDGAAVAAAADSDRTTPLKPALCNNGVCVGSDDSSVTKTQNSVIADTDAVTKNGSRRQAKQTPKRQSGFITHKAALNLASSFQVLASEFHDFVCARSFDVISGGMYRKFLVQSRASKEEWAFGVQTSMCKIQRQVKTLIGMVNSLKCVEEGIMEQTVVGAFPTSVQNHHSDSNEPPQQTHKRTLYSVLSDVMNSSTPPTQRRVHSIKPVPIPGCKFPSFEDPSSVAPSVYCSVTGIKLDDLCVEVKPSGRIQQRLQRDEAGCEKKEEEEESATKENGNGTSCATKQKHQSLITAAVFVHADLEHFFNMFWFCYKIEHIVRHMARCWLEDYNQKILSVAVDKSPEEMDGSGADQDMQSMCELFSREQEGAIKEMHSVMLHAFSHVLESLYAFPCMQKMCADVEKAESDVLDARRSEASSGAKRRRKKPQADHRFEKRSKMNDMQFEDEAGETIQVNSSFENRAKAASARSRAKGSQSRARKHKTNSARQDSSGSDSGRDLEDHSKRAMSSQCQSDSGSCCDSDM